jgi:hypothetical protein
LELIAVIAGKLARRGEVFRLALDVVVALRFESDTCF